MSDFYRLTKTDWDSALRSFISHYTILAPVEEEGHIDYTPIDEEDVERITYNKPKPTTPLKTLLLPVKESLADPSSPENPWLIMGIPACDLHAKSLLDQFYLDPEYPDPFYKNRTENSIFIGTDCHGHQEHCHCTSYGFKPYPTANDDIHLVRHGTDVYVSPVTEKGEKFIEKLSGSTNLSKCDQSAIDWIESKRKETVEDLDEHNKNLPGYEKSGELINASDEEIWKEYGDDCVSCGACATICPTCTCFLLIDKPGLLKQRQVDACQYPAFEKVAAGEDPLDALHKRFSNRYMCKYVWRPERFEELACTGCGRCIEACIGGINKNELIKELANNA
ncbi:MAG: 4Fe-4S dicluster domain-containing protein [Bacteroidales bacterium]|nr:4Fe-4S dicluster domain-containing protein [Bacteroidales bacterium]